MLTKKYLILFLAIAIIPFVGVIPVGLGFIGLIVMFYLPITLSSIAVILFSFTRLSKNKIAIFSVIPGGLYTIVILNEWISGSHFGLS